jgi:orotidine-5'-phosphate decarboxylase
MDTIRDKLIVALDLPSIAEAEAMVAQLGDAVSFYKIGMELVYAGGLPLVRQLADSGKNVFLDLKLHDIPNTVQKATERLAGTGATFLTVHAYPQTMQAALAGAAGSDLRILGVSVLTSMDHDDLARAGFGLGVSDLVRRRAKQAAETGIHGLVCSPQEIAMVRETVGQSLAIVTPGIRPSGSATGDQKRIATPAKAIRDGADHLVVGRPITDAGNAAAMAESIVQEIATSL